jgi:hypothetical protein
VAWNLYYSTCGLAIGGIFSRDDEQEEGHVDFEIFIPTVKTTYVRRINPRRRL